MSSNFGYEKPPPHRQWTEKEQSISRGRERLKRNTMERSSNNEGRQKSLVQHCRNDSVNSIETVDRSFPSGVRSNVGQKKNVDGIMRQAQFADRDRYGSCEAMSHGPYNNEKDSRREYHERLERKLPYESLSSSTSERRRCLEFSENRAPNTSGLEIVKTAPTNTHRNYTLGNGRDRPRSDRRENNSSSRSSSISSPSRGRENDRDRNLEAVSSKRISKHVRSRSRGQVRSSSSSSYDARSPVRGKKDQNFSGFITELAEAALKALTEGQYNPRPSPNHGNYKSQNTTTRGEASREVVYPVNTGGAATPQFKNTRNSSPLSDFSSQGSNLLSSSDEERQLKKIRHKGLLSGVLATATTIHATNVIYKNRKKQRTRQKQLAEGEISIEEAKRERNRARLMDVTFVGIAAMGIKAAATEWKEMKEKKSEIRDIREKKQKIHEKRQEERRTNTCSHNVPGCYRGSEPGLNASYYGTSGGYDESLPSARPLLPPVPTPPLLDTSGSHLQPDS